MQKIFISMTMAVTMLTMIASAHAVPVVNFFTDRTAFEAAAGSLSLIDFEGIVADNTFGALVPSNTIDGVTFSTTGGTSGVSGANGPVSGAPYNSALLFSNNSIPIAADVSGIGGVVAVGGFFGNIISDASATLTLVGATGLLDTQNVTAGDMGLGNAETFFGWTVSGDTIVSVTNDSIVGFEGIDDFVFATALADTGNSGNSVPEPGTLAILGIGIAGLSYMRRRRKFS